MSHSLVDRLSDRALWTVHRGISPIVATTIHDGGLVRDDLKRRYALSSKERRREEDPFTEYIMRDLPNRIIVHRSRFEVDINRHRSGAVYLTPEQAWGLTVWRDHPSAEQVEIMLQTHDDYYEMLREFLRGVERRHGCFVVLDIHSYNHRRAGPKSAPTSQEMAPDINIGTSSMDRIRWSVVVETLMSHFRSFEIGGRPLDVRENVAFQGKGEQTRFIHQQFPSTGCAIAIEFKKFFMDEWTGEPDMVALGKLRDIVATCVPLLERVLEQRR